MSRDTNTAEVFLRRLKQIGVEFLFSTPGPDFQPFAEVFHAVPAGELPRPMIVPHEALALSMAQGYFLATGRPQAVLVNFGAGLVNGLPQVMAAAKMDLPLLLISGMPNLARATVKGTFEACRPEELDPTLTRAWEIMSSSPQGPVVVSFPRDILRAPLKLGAPLNPQALHPPVPAASDLARVRAALLESSRSLVITTRSGRNPALVPLLEEFAERYQVGVICPQAQALNIRTDHPCFLGSVDDRVLGEADLILVLDTESPWDPQGALPAPGARVFHLGPDPLFGRVADRVTRSDLNVVTGIEQALTGLLALAPPKKMRPESAWITANREALHGARLSAPLAKFNSSSVAEVLSLCLSEETILINESSLPADFLTLRHPAGYLRTSAVLGWSLGCALGFKLGQPARLPIAVVGDGAFYLSQPLAAQWTAQTRGLPFMTIVLNDGAANSSSHKQFNSISPGLPFAAIGEAAGLWGATVSTRPELKNAIDEGLKHVREGRTVLIDARI